MGQYQKALPYFQQALEQRRALGDKCEEADILSKIAEVYGDGFGDGGTAWEYQKQANKIKGGERCN